MRVLSDIIRPINDTWKCLIRKYGKGGDRKWDGKGGIFGSDIKENVLYDIHM